MGKWVYHFWRGDGKLVIIHAYGMFGLVKIRYGRRDWIGLDGLMKEVKSNIKGYLFMYSYDLCSSTHSVYASTPSQANQVIPRIPPFPD